MKKTLQTLIACATLTFASVSFAELINCKVTEVTSGNTLTCQVDQKKPIEVKLYSVKAPLLGQNFGNESKQALSDMVLGKQVTIETHGKDELKRTIGTLTNLPKNCIFYGAIVCTHNSTYFNYEMIERGMAWADNEQTKDAIYEDAEKMARANKLGIWSQSSSTPP